MTCRVEGLAEHARLQRPGLAVTFDGRLATRVELAADVEVEKQLLEPGEQQQIERFAAQGEGAIAAGLDVADAGGDVAPPGGGVDEELAEALRPHLDAGVRGVVERRPGHAHSRAVAATGAEGSTAPSSWAEGAAATSSRSNTVAKWAARRCATSGSGQALPV